MASSEEIAKEGEPTRREAGKSDECGYDPGPPGGRFQRALIKDLPDTEVLEVKPGESLT